MGWEYFLLLLPVVWPRVDGGRESPAWSDHSHCVLSPGTALLRLGSLFLAAGKAQNAGHAGDTVLKSRVLLEWKIKRRFKDTTGQGSKWVCELRKKAAKHRIDGHRRV